MSETLLDKVNEANAEFRRRLHHVSNCQKCQDVIQGKFGNQVAGAAAVCSEYQKENSK